MQFPLPRERPEAGGFSRARGNMLWVGAISAFAEFGVLRSHPLGLGLGGGGFHAACQLCCFQMRDRNILQLVLALAGGAVLADLPASMNKDIRKDLKKECSGNH